jgi:hypothetical protein
LPYAQGSKFHVQYTQWVDPFCRFAVRRNSHFLKGVDGDNVSGRGICRMRKVLNFMFNIRSGLMTNSLNIVMATKSEKTKWIPDKNLRE